MNTNRRQFAVFLVLALLGAGVATAVQDDAKQTDNAKQSEDAKKSTDEKEKKSDHKRDYGVMFGTAYGPDDRPMYGVHITIHPVGKKHPSWELQSDHHGEFAQRVPPVEADYLVVGEIEVAPLLNGKPQTSKKKRLKGEATVHINGAEWHDFSLHIND